jgi:RHS repeat-associated protein
MAWDGENATALDVAEYGKNALRRSFAGREPETAGDDFVLGGWSLGNLALERKSIKFGFGEAYSWTQKRGGKSYELSDHLGNVAVVVGDRRMAVDGNSDLTVDFFEAEVLSARDFYPFGFQMPDRTFQTEKYRYGFQSQESDSEWLGEGNAVAFKYRVHDPRVGRFLSVDPLEVDYPWYSTYQFSGNITTSARELEGLEPDFQPNSNETGLTGPAIDRSSSELADWRWTGGNWENTTISNEISPNHLTGSIGSNIGNFSKGILARTSHRYQLEPARGATLTGIRDTYWERPKDGRKVGNWVIRVDEPHRGANYHHININEELFSGYSDPHTKISPKTAQSLVKLGKGVQYLGRVARPVAVVTDFVRISNAINSDGGAIGPNTIKESRSVASGWLGGVLGGYGGSTLGGYIGSFFGPPGIVAGEIIGGFLGAWGGAELLSELSSESE